MTAAPTPRFETLDQLPAFHAATRPEAVAIGFEGRMLDWRSFSALCDGVAALLRQQAGVKAGQRVAWLGLSHPLQLALLFALARLGAILVPLNFRLAPGEWQAQLADCGASLLVHDAAWRDAALALSCAAGVRPLDCSGWTDAVLHDAALQDAAVTAAAAPDASTASASDASTAGAPEAPAVRADSPVLLVFTSGTTSRPKAAVHTQRNLLANMAIASSVQAMTPADRVATVLPMFHVGGLCIQTLPALYAGATVLLHARFQPDEALRCFSHDRPSLTLLVPAVMKALIEHPDWAGADLSSLRAVWAGSSVLPGALVRAFHDRGLPVCNVYGSTETGPFSIALSPGQAMSHEGSCGWPAPGVEVCLRPVASAAAGGVPAAAGAPNDGTAGEILVRAPNVVERYWPDQPARDAEGWFHTGDLAQCAADGSYTVVGRVKDLIISGGENLHPAEVEEPLALHPAVLECAAFGLPDAQWGEAVAVAVVLRPGAAADEAALRAWLHERLARYKQPRRWLFVDALPRTALGKVQRHTLVALATGDAKP